MVSRIFLFVQGLWEPTDPCTWVMLLLIRSEDWFSDGDADTHHHDGLAHVEEADYDRIGHCYLPRILGHQLLPEQIRHYSLENPV